MHEKIILALSLMLCGCPYEKDGNNAPMNQMVLFEFSEESELLSLPSFGDDPSYIENGALVAPILTGQHKGLGRKFWFSQQGDNTEPDEIEMTFVISMDANFQKHGVPYEAGKFSGAEGIYDNSAGWGGKQVTTQNSWSVRIGHTGENSAGEIPIGLYVYHPGMADQYGTAIDSGISLKREQEYTLQLYIKLNDVGQQNGILKLSVGDATIYHSNTWLLRNDQSVHIKSVWLDAYIGGTTPSQFDTFSYLDDLKINW